MVNNNLQPETACVEGLKSPLGTCNRLGHFFKVLLDAEGVYILESYSPNLPWEALRSST